MKGQGQALNPSLPVSPRPAPHPVCRPWLWLSPRGRQLAPDLCFLKGSGQSQGLVSPLRPVPWPGSCMCTLAVPFCDGWPRSRSSSLLSWGSGGRGTTTSNPKRAQAAQGGSQLVPVIWKGGEEEEVTRGVGGRRSLSSCLKVDKYPRAKRMRNQEPKTRMKAGTEERPLALAARALRLGGEPGKMPAELTPQAFRRQVPIRKEAGLSSGLGFLHLEKLPA